MKTVAKDRAARRREFVETALQHIDAVFARAQFLLRNAADAKEATQECYLRAVRLCSGYSGSNMRAWLLMILKDVIDAEFLDRNARPSPPDWWKSENRALDVLGDLDLPAKDGHHRPESKARQQLFDALPDPVREVVMLREFDALSYKEIAALIGAPVGIVMARLAQARSILQIAAVA